MQRGARNVFAGRTQDDDLTRMSDPGPEPRTAPVIVGELHAIIRRARITAPYVLVGASIAGVYARLYAYTYPHTVAGIVLVDAAHEEELAQLDATITCPARDIGCWEIVGVAKYRAVEEARAARGAVPLAGIPLVALTSGRYVAAPTATLSDLEASGDPSYAYWLSFQSDLVDQSDDSRQIIATDSAHCIACN